MLNEIIKAGLIDRLKDIETALKVIIDKYNDISEFELDYNNYKVFYQNIYEMEIEELQRICEDQTQKVDEICNLRNNLINPVVELNDEDIYILLNNPEKKFNKESIRRIDAYFNIRNLGQTEELPF